MENCYVIGTTKSEKRTGERLTIILYPATGKVTISTGRECETKMSGKVAGLAKLTSELKRAGEAYIVMPSRRFKIDVKKHIGIVEILDNAILASQDINAWLKKKHDQHAKMLERKIASDEFRVRAHAQRIANDEIRGKIIPRKFSEALRKHNAALEVNPEPVREAALAIARATRKKWHTEFHKKYGKVIEVLRIANSPEFNKQFRKEVRESHIHKLKESDLIIE